MPDVAVIIGVFYTVKNLLHRIELVRAKHHHALFAIMQHDVLADNLSQCTLVEEHRSKLLQVIERNICRIRPVKCELISAIRIIGEITSIHAIGYYKQLDIVEQPMQRSLMITLYLIVRLFQFHASALQLYLNQRQAIDK